MIDFGKYTEALQESKRQPYCQIITPSSSDEAFGIFIADSEAESAEFKPDDSWELVEKKFKSPEGTVKRNGWMLKIDDQEGFNQTYPCHIAVVHFGSALVYQGTKVVNSMYDYSSGNKELTPEGKLAEDPNDKNYYKGNKLVLYFLDSSLNPLSTKPFQLKIKGAFRGAFSTNYIYYKREFEQVFLEQAKANNLFKGTKRLDVKYLSLACFKFKIGMRVAQEGTEVCTLSTVYLPAINDIGKKRKSKNSEVTYILEDLGNLFIDIYGENGEFGHQIFEDVDAYSNFSVVKYESNNGNQEKQQKVYDLVTEDLKWSIEEAQEFLNKHYGKTSRKKLTEEELEDSIKKLESHLPLHTQLYRKFKESGLDDEGIEAFCLDQGATSLSDLDEAFLQDQLDKKSPSESAPPTSDDMLDDIPF